MPTDKELLAEAVEFYFGSKCPDYDDDNCVCCRAWRALEGWGGD